MRHVGWRLKDRLVIVMRNTHRKSEAMHCDRAMYTGLGTFCLLVSCGMCLAVVPRHVSDTELADLLIVVVERWDKAKLDAHAHTRNEAGMGQVVDRYEVRKWDRRFTIRLTLARIEVSRTIVMETKSVNCIFATSPRTS